MAIHDHAGTPPTTDWLKRFAGTLLSLVPQMRPLEAVRRAMMAFPDCAGQKPEEAAHQHASHEWPDSEVPANVLPLAARGQSDWRTGAPQRSPRG